MDYPRYRAAGLPIGSGAVEVACRSVVCERLKKSGMFRASPTPARSTRCAALSNPTPSTTSGNTGRRRKKRPEEQIWFTRLSENRIEGTVLIFIFSRFADMRDFAGSLLVEFSCCHAEACRPNPKRHDAFRSLRAGRAGVLRIEGLLPAFGAHDAEFRMLHAACHSPSSITVIALSSGKARIMKSRCTGRIH